MTRSRSHSEKVLSRSVFCQLPQGLLSRGPSPPPDETGANSGNWRGGRPQALLNPSDKASHKAGSRASECCRLGQRGPRAPYGPQGGTGIRAVLPPRPQPVISPGLGPA